MATYYGPPALPKTSMPQPGRVRKPSDQSVTASMSDIMRFKNAVYYPNYRVYRGETPASLNYSCISHVFYAFAHVSPDGVVFLSDEKADLRMPVDGSSGCLGSFMHLKEKYEHLKLILSIGGGSASQNFASVAANTATRETFARSAKGLVEATGFDGIDVDWEHPSTPEQGRHLLALLASMRLHLPSNRYLLTAALPAGKWALQNIDLARAQEYLDFINLMAYEFAGPWSQRSGHQARLFPESNEETSGSVAVDYIISSGFPADRILLGIPVFGRSFLGATGPGQVFTGCGGQDGTFDCKQLPRPGTHEIVDTNTVAASCVGGDGGFVSYDNPETVKMKAKYCREKSLGGLFYWTGTGDAPSGPRSLILSGFNGLHNV